MVPDRMHNKNNNSKQKAVNKTRKDTKTALQHPQ